MESLPLINLVSIIHLILLAIWAGIIATETVIELYAYKKMELHFSTIQFHYWIDLLVELPVVLGMLTTGIILFTIAEDITTLHIIKIILGLTAISSNFICIYIVLQRSKILKYDDTDERLWGLSGRIIKIVVIAVPLGITAFIIGIYLAHQRILKLIAG